MGRTWLVALVAVAGCGRVGFEGIGDAALGGEHDAATDSRGSSDGLQRAPYTYVHSHSDETDGATTSLAVTLTPVTSGHLLVVGVGFDFEVGGGTPAVTLDDTRGDAYVIAVPPDGQNGYAQYLAYAVAQDTGACSVTVTLDRPSQSFLEMWVLEYAGTEVPPAQSIGSPFDAGAIEHGGSTGAVVSTPEITTTGSDELLITIAVGGGKLSTAGGATLRELVAGDLAEEGFAPTPGTYQMQVNVDDGSSYTTSIAAFR